MNRAKTMIVGSVPLVMVMNLFLLNYFFGDINTQLSTASPNSTVKTDSIEVQAMRKFDNSISNFKVQRKYNKISFPKPASHTFAEVSSGDIAEAEGNIKSQGVVIK